jgi:hypothetical protein
MLKEVKVQKLLKDFPSCKICRHALQYYACLDEMQSDFCRSRRTNMNKGKYQELKKNFQQLRQLHTNFLLQMFRFNPSEVLIGFMVVIVVGFFQSSLYHLTNTVYKFIIITRVGSTSLLNGKVQRDYVFSHLLFHTLSHVRTHTYGGLPKQNRFGVKASQSPSTLCP